MSILGIGTDIVSVERIERLLDDHGTRFLKRCFVDSERQAFTGVGKGLAQSVAGRWAAKEAFLKAVGGPIKHIPYRSIAVVRRANGGPQLIVEAQAADQLLVRGGKSMHLSISHERQYAVATVIIED